jgi:single-strand DNA-binding protein
MNTITIVGKVGGDPEVKYTPSGTAVVKLSVADEERVKGTKKTHWHTCVGWGKLAEDVIAPYVHKGDNIHIVGRVSYNKWEKDGQKHTSTEITIEKLQLLGGSRPASAEPGSGDDDIPF